jgi:outer membrane receptor protein involved in Fe transport
MKFPFAMFPSVEQTLLAAAVCAIFSSVVNADTVPEDLDALAELSLEQLMDVKITSASKFSQKASEAPASVSVLTAEDFRAYGWRTLADALASVRGFYVTYDRAYSFLGARGFQPVGDYNSRVLLLIDGYRFNDNIFDQAQTGREFGLEADLIERIEIVRGPSSSVYGGNAFFGVVNVITKPAAVIGGTHGGELSGGIGSYGAQETRASFGKTFPSGARLVLSANRYESDGPTLAFPGEASTGGAPVANTDREKGNGFFAKFEDGGFRVNFMHSDRQKGVTGGLYGVPVDPRNFTRDSHSFIDASYSRTVGALEWTGRLSYSEYRYDGDYYYDPAIVSRDVANGRWWNAELKGVTAFGRHKLVLGLEFQNNSRQDQSNFDVEPYTLYLDDRRHSQRTGVFVQDDFALNEHLTFSGGLRYDHYDYGDAELNPRLGLIYRMSDRTVGKLLYGTAFRPPNAFESHYSFTGLYAANPNLQPESITTYEAVLETTPADNLQLIATLFEYRIKNLLLPGIDPVSGLAQFQNLGKASAEGIEFETAYAWESRARLRASYALQRSKDYMGNTLSNSPRQLAKLNVSVAFSEALRAGLEAQYVGSRHTEISAIPGYTLVHLTLGSEHSWKGVDVQATVRNVLDKRHFHPADLADPTRDMLEQNGRTILGKAVFRF